MSTSNSTSSSARPTVPERDLSYTHVFPARRAPAKERLATLPDTCSTKAQLHHSIDQVSAFHGGLDWLIEAAVESEPKREPWTLRGEPLTEDSLQKLNEPGERKSWLAEQKRLLDREMKSGAVKGKTVSTLYTSSDGSNTRSYVSKESP